VTSKVVVLDLCGMTPDEAIQSAGALLADRSVPDLSRLLVTADTALLPAHGAAFEQLLTSGRLHQLVCVAVGPPAIKGRILIPGSISAGRGSAVLWVGDRLGIDWPMSVAADPLMRPDSVPNGLQLLTEVLSADEVYERVQQLADQIPNGVACPGLRLAEPEVDEESFAEAIAEAIGRLLEPRGSGGPDSSEPFAKLHEDSSAHQRLTEDGELARARQRCVFAVGQAAAAGDAVHSVAFVVGSGRPVQAARERVVAVGQALSIVRDLVAELTENLPSASEMTERQRERLRKAGFSLAEKASAWDQPGAVSGSDAETSPRAAVLEVVTRALRDGEALPDVCERLAATESLLRPAGGAVQRARLDQQCPPRLLDELLKPQEFPPPEQWLPPAGALVGVLAGLAGLVAGLVGALVWTALVGLTVLRSARPPGSDGRSLILNMLGAVAGAAAGWGISRSARPAEPVALAAALLALVIAVSVVVLSWRARAQDWRRTLSTAQAAEAAESLAEQAIASVGRAGSANRARLEAVARARITLSGVGNKLLENADRSRGSGAAHERAPQSVRLSYALSPGLVDLVLAVLSAMPAQSVTDGESDYVRAQAKTTELIGVWDKHAREHGSAEPPPFAMHGGYDVGSWDDVSIDMIKTAVGGDPRDVMWQLCQPGDLPMLDLGGEPLTVPFAPRPARRALAGALPPDTAETLSGHHAGLLRLVPLKLAGVTASWSVSSGQVPPQ
jgi:hypothetical protein